MITKGMYQLNLLRLRAPNVKNITFTHKRLNGHCFSRSEEFPSRWRTVIENIQDFGTYDLTTEELKYGCCLAWRNEPRCPARIQWKNLVSIHTDEK